MRFYWRWKGCQNKISNTFKGISGREAMVNINGKCDIVSYLAKEVIITHVNIINVEYLPAFFCIGIIAMWTKQGKTITT